MSLQSSSAMLGPIKSLAGAASGFVGSAAVQHGTAPPTTAPSGPPPRSAFALEARAALQLPRLLLSSPRLATVPRGDDGPVVDIPGWKAPESSMAPLRAYLRWLGHDARTWGFGTNAGDPEGDVERMAESVAELADARGRPVALVGWSLGGVIAREVARKIPGQVEQVITYGTPVIGGPAHTVAVGSYEPGEGDRVDALIEELSASDPILAPIAVIFTKRDGVVAWQACIDRFSPHADHIEVASTHLGLGIDPDVWEIVARRLASRPS